MKLLAGYLYGTHGNGLILDPNRANSFKVYTDAELYGNWYRPTASNDPWTEKLRSWCILIYVGCPIIQTYKLYTVIASSSAEAGYVSL